MNLLSASEIRSGQLLGNFRIEHLVATGGMASIFRGTDLDTGHPVAVKIPHPHKAGDRAALDRIRNEAEIGGRLNHPGIVKILANDSFPRYTVTEWADGKVLRRTIDEQGKLPVGRTVRIAHAICDVIEYMHSRGVVHRDLKPENVIVDASGNIKLIDFGIAGPAKWNIWKRTMPAEAMGTPDYASPEQVKGKPIDARSDIYSLGVMMFEMLAGVVPFSGLDPITAMNLRATVDAPPIREFRSDLSPSLQSIVDRALARDKGKRHASARELGSEFSKVLAEESKEPAFESVGVI